jgi:hypothetical protein
MKFYTYLWLREDGTPYYVGKGSGRRAYKIEKRHVPPKDRNNIVLQYWPDEETALAYEVYQIDFWGRKDLGAGCLRNFSDGGDNPPNHKGKPKPEGFSEKLRKANLGKRHTEESKRKNREAHLGKTTSEETKSKMRNSHNLRPKPPWKHGTDNCYSRHGCRCKSCKEGRRSRWLKTKR